MAIWGRNQLRDMQCAAVAERIRKQLESETSRKDTKGNDMKLDELYPSKWLKASDLQGRQVTCEIDKVIVEDLGDSSKPVLYFVAKERGLVLNRTNADVIGAALGDDTDLWVGGKVTLFASKVNYRGQLVDAIRLTCSKPKPKPAAAREAGDDSDDDLRF